MVAVNAGRFVSSILTNQGGLYTWGKSSGQHCLGYSVDHADVQRVPRQVTTIKMVQGVEFGFDHAVAFTRAGAVYTWGEGVFSQLGHAGSNAACVQPTRVLAALEDVRVVAVAAGKRFTLCATDDGAVFSWGAGTLGQLGHPEKKRQTEPRAIAALSEHRIVAVSCGYEHTLALSAKGELFGWGDCKSGCVGNGKTSGVCPTPTLVQFGGEPSGAATEVRTISSGANHNAVVDSRGFLYAWGQASLGRLGFDDAASQPVARPRKVSSRLLSMGGGAKAVSCGEQHTACVTETDDVLLWGCNQDGRLGQGAGQAAISLAEPSILNVTPLVSRQADDHVGFKTVSCGLNHSLAISSSGGVFAWGATRAPANYGQLGEKMSPVFRVAGRAGGTPAARATLAVEESGSDSDSSGVGMISPRHQLRPKQLLKIAGGSGADPHPSLHSPASRAETQRAAFHEDGGTDSDSSGVGELGSDLKVAALKRPKQMLNRDEVGGDGVDPHPGLHTPASRSQELWGGKESPATNEYDSSASVDVLRKALKDLQRKQAMGTLSRAVGQFVRIVSKQHTVALSRALHHWRVNCVVESMTKVVVGEVNRVRTDSAKVAPTLFRSVFNKAYTHQCRRGFNKLQYNMMVKTALEATVQERQALLQKIEGMTNDQERAKHRLHYNREILRGRLLKTSIRYGRDKICAVLLVRSRHSTRDAFSRWKLHSQAKQRADALRRGRLKLRVNMDRVEIEREKYAQMQKDLDKSRQLFGVFLAFHKWRQHRDKEVKAHEMQKIRKERQLLKRELAVLLQRMREMKEVEETTRRTSAQRGVAMMNEVMDQMKLLTAASKKRRVRIDAWVGKEQG